MTGAQNFETIHESDILNVPTIMKRIIYIAHPVRGDVPGNRAKILAICDEITRTEHEVFAWAPYLQSISQLDDMIAEDRDLGIRINTACLESGIVSELWLYGDRISDGMSAEIAIAESHGIRIVPKTDGTRRDFALRRTPA